jgi:hypothetical protein
MRSVLLPGNHNNKPRPAPLTHTLHILKNWQGTLRDQRTIRHNSDNAFTLIDEAIDLRLLMTCYPQYTEDQAKGRGVY